jgi:hypothetical protein
MSLVFRHIYGCFRFQRSMGPGLFKSSLMAADTKFFPMHGRFQTVRTSVQSYIEVTRLASPSSVSCSCLISSTVQLISKALSLSRPGWLMAREAERNETVSDGPPSPPSRPLPREAAAAPTTPASWPRRPRPRRAPEAPRRSGDQRLRGERAPGVGPRRGAPVPAPPPGARSSGSCGAGGLGRHPFGERISRCWAVLGAAVSPLLQVAAPVAEMAVAQLGIF